MSQVARVLPHVNPNATTADDLSYVLDRVLFRLGRHRITGPAPFQATHENMALEAGRESGMGKVKAESV